MSSPHPEDHNVNVTAITSKGAGVTGEPKLSKTLLFQWAHSIQVVKEGTEVFEGNGSRVPFLRTKASISS